MYYPPNPIHYNVGISSGFATATAMFWDLPPGKDGATILYPPNEIVESKKEKPREYHWRNKRFGHTIWDDQPTCDNDEWILIGYRDKKSD